MGCNRWRMGLATGLSVSVVSVVASAVLFFYVPSVIRNVVNENTKLGFDGEGNLTSTTRAWKDPRYEMSMSVYTFSVLNPDAVVKVDAKPKVQEKGPYVFTEVQHKEIRFEANNTRVFYRNKKSYFFNQTASCSSCKLSDQITVPNIVLQTIIDKLPNSGIIRSLVDTVLQVEKESAFVTTTVGQFLFEGYVDPLISTICSKPILSSFCKAQSIPLKVGLFYGKNGTDDGVYQVGTGLADPLDLSKVFSYKNMTHTVAYYSDKARVIKGTDGQMFPPGLDQTYETTLDIFVGPMCRSIQMERVGHGEHQGVPVYHYGPAKSMHDVDIQRSLGFCNPQSPRYFNNTYIQRKDCAPMGIMDVSSCLDGNPRIYISQPHFFGSHPAVHNAIAGLAPPSEENDGTVLGIEPVTSTVVFADQRTQLNLGVLDGDLKSLAGMSPRIVPMVWLREWASFDKATRDELAELTSTNKGVFIASVASFLFSCVVIVGVGILVVLNNRKRDADETHLLEEDDEQQTDTDQ